VGWREVEGGGEASSLFRLSQPLGLPATQMAACWPACEGGGGGAGRKGEKTLLCNSHDGGGGGEEEQKNAQWPHASAVYFGTIGDSATSSRQQRPLLEIPQSFACESDHPPGNYDRCIGKLYSKPHGPPCVKDTYNRQQDPFRIKRSTQLFIKPDCTHREQIEEKQLHDKTDFRSLMVRSPGKYVHF